jgi:outer membrane immunogenic protein
MRRLGPGLLVGFVVAASALATAASAADLPVPATPPAAYRPVIYDWSGFYFGANVGGTWGNDTVTTTTTTALQPAGTVTKVSPMGVIGGGQVGVNAQFSSFVVGAEGMWDWTSLTGQHSTASAFLANTAEQSTVSATWLAAVTGRAGFAVNDFLFYAKGGAAWMRSDHTQTVTGAGGAFITQTIITDTRSGFTVGAGGEFGMTENLSARLEYDYFGFGTRNYNFTQIATVQNGPTGVLPVSEKSSVQMVVVGLNYRFNWH